MTVPGRPDIVRLRQLAREGLTVLVGDDASPPPRPDWLPPGIPLAVRRLRDLDDRLADALDARPDELWVLRPDGHVAAVVSRTEDVAPAVARLLATPLPAPVPA